MMRTVKLSAYISTICFSLNLFGNRFYRDLSNCFHLGRYVLGDVLMAENNLKILFQEVCLS